MSREKHIWELKLPGCLTGIAQQRGPRASGFHAVKSTGWRLQRLRGCRLFTLTINWMSLPTIKWAVVFLVNSLERFLRLS